MEKQMNIIILAAGQSSRFPNCRPKYLLTAYDHRLMIEHCIKCFDEVQDPKITIVILREHCKEYQADVFLAEALPNINVLILEEPTNGPTETTQLAISMLNITGPVYVKDCDTFIKFEKPVTECNGVAVGRLNDYPNLYNVTGKSYVKADTNGIISSVIEKQVVSNLFSVGGYQFRDADAFLQTADKLLKNSTQEIYLSNVIDSMIADGEIFEVVHTTDFKDVGTIEDWIMFNRQHPVLFVDIDGVLVRNQSRYGKNKFGTTPEVLHSNVQTLLEQQTQGAQFIFTTARPSEYDVQTHAVLLDLGFTDYRLISGINTTNRILINDFDFSNPFPTAEAINVKRNSEELERYFK